MLFTGQLDEVGSAHLTWRILTNVHYKGMPNVLEIAHQLLGEVVANSLNVEGCLSAEEFLRKYETIKDANKYTVGEKV